MDTILCNKCQCYKSPEEFHTRKSGSKDPLKRSNKQSNCISCRREIDKKYYLRDKEGYARRNRHTRIKLRDEVREIKATAGCLYCEECEPCCLDFHHPNDNKESTVSSLVMKASRLKALKEIAKCEVVCRNCHAKLHAGLIVPRQITEALGSS